MDGVHDMGGMHGFGPVVREENEPVFHAAWERHVYAIRLGARDHDIYHLDESRRAIEQMEPAHYLRASYYERWLYSIEANLVEKGVLQRGQIEARLQQLRARPDTPLPVHVDAGQAGRLLAALRLDVEPAGDDVAAPPRFAVGDRVLTRNMHPHGHTRLPRYARGKRGVIERVYRAYLLPDTNAHGLGRDPQPVYSVGFTAAELWGDSAEPNQLVNIDLWESYLLPA